MLQESNMEDKLDQLAKDYPTLIIKFNNGKKYWKANINDPKSGLPFRTVQFLPGQSDKDVLNGLKNSFDSAVVDIIDYSNKWGIKYGQ